MNIEHLQGISFSKSDPGVARTTSNYVIITNPKNSKHLLDIVTILFIKYRSKYTSTNLLFEYVSKCIFEEDVKQYIDRQKDKTTHGIINFNVFLV